MNESLALYGLEPFFFNGAAGRCFAVFYPPEPDRASDRAVLMVPPFAEEMNKSRRMMAMQARALAAAGIAVLLPDLYGTGDSEGDFSAARWDIWRGDLISAMGLLADRGYSRIDVLSLRLGALLALDMARAAPPMLKHIVLWQPVIKGETAVAQFLRLRLAAAMMDSTREQESTSGLRARIAAGEALEVAGYEVAAALFTAIDGLDMESLVMPARNLHWLELVAAEGRAGSPASQRMVERLRAQGVSVAAMTVVGEPFWSTPEITLAPALITATTAIFTSFSA